MVQLVGRILIVRRMGSTRSLSAQYQAVGGVLRLERVHVGPRPADECLLLVFAQYGVAVYPGVGCEGHFAAFHHFYNFLEFVVLYGDAAGSEVGEVQFAFAFIDVVGQPTGNGLDFGIPGINGAVAVAIVAGDFQDGLDGIRNRVFPADVVADVVGQIFFRADELRQQEDDGEANQDGFDVLFHGKLICVAKVGKPTGIRCRCCIAVLY